jgi:hypothetical protein
MQVRAKWTDDRLDDLSSRVGHLESRMEARFDKLEGRFDRLQNTLIVTLGALVAATLTLVATAQFGGRRIKAAPLHSFDTPRHLPGTSLRRGERRARCKAPG